MENLFNNASSLRLLENYIRSMSKGYYVDFGGSGIPINKTEKNSDHTDEDTENDHTKKEENSDHTSPNGKNKNLRKKRK